MIDAKRLFNKYSSWERTENCSLVGSRHRSQPAVYYVNRGELYKLDETSVVYDVLLVAAAAFRTNRIRLFELSPCLVSRYALCISRAVRATMEAESSEAVSLWRS